MFIIKNHILVLIQFLIISQLSFSANPDSLEKVLVNVQNEKQKLLILADLGWYYRDLKPEKGIAFAEDGLALARKLNDKNLEIELLGTIGANYLNIGEFPKAICYYDTGYKKALIINNNKVAGKYLNNIGVAYRKLGDYAKAIEKYMVSLRLSEEEKDSGSIASTYNNIGTIYDHLNLFDNALEYYTKALRINISLNKPEGISSCYNNIANLYTATGKYNQAIEFHIKSLKIAQELNDLNSIGITYANIGLAFEAKKEFSLALDYYEKAQSIAHQTQNSDLIINTYNYFSSVYSKTGKYKEGVELAGKALEISKSTNSLEGIRDSYNLLFLNYEKSGDYKNAFGFFNKYVEIKDSINQKDLHRIIAEQTAIKTAEEHIKNAVREKDNYIKILLKDKEIKNSRTILLILILIILIISAIIFYYMFRKTAKINSDLELALNNLKETEENLRNLNTTKDIFFKVITHDLKNPLNVFLNVSEYIRQYYKDMDAEEIEGFIKDINQSSKSLSSLLENLVLWTNLQSNKIIINTRQIYISELMQVVIPKANYYASQKNIKIEKDIGADYEISCDIELTNEALQRIISNAIKYSYPGDKIDIYSVLNSDNTVSIVVRDNGVGIEDDIQKTMFILEEHYSKPGTAGEPGTGLGLVLTKIILEKLGGLISFNSRVGYGSEFTITFPLAKH